MNAAVDWNHFNALLARGDMAGAQALISGSQPSSPAPIAPEPVTATPAPAKAKDLGEWCGDIAARVAAPAIDQAAQTGMAIMGALGQAMTPEQAAWVQDRLDKSPEFFASVNCKDAIDIFIAEWQNFEKEKQP